MDSDMKTIIVTGAGQLGSRHLQALALLSEPARIVVTDPSPASLAVAEERFRQIPGNELHEVTFHRTPGESGVTHADLAVVATAADVRRGVITMLLQEVECRMMILEKVLFQKLDDFAFVGSLFDSYGVSAWVNCPRRLFPTYISIRDIVGDERVAMSVTGTGWGLGSNGIHFIDLFEYLTGMTVSEWHPLLDKEVIKSKREGFVEFTGTVFGNAGGHTLSLTSLPGDKTGVTVTITTAHDRWTIAESAGTVMHEWHEGGWKSSTEKYSMIYQSAMTNLVAGSLFNTGDCGLTPYGTSALMHLPYIAMLIHHLNRTFKTDICPIT